MYELLQEESEATATDTEQNTIEISDRLFPGFCDQCGYRKPGRIINGARMRFRQVKANEWVQPVRKGYKLACCDCGLVHDLDFRLIKRRKAHFIQFRARRNNRATGQLRRHL